MTDPGATAFTRILFFAKDRAMFLVKLLTPPFEALYEVIFGIAVTAFMELMVMMEHDESNPLSDTLAGCCVEIIARAADWQVRNTPFKFTAITLSKSCSVS